MANQQSHDFCIRARDWMNIMLFNQLVFQLMVISNDAVVDYSDAPLVIEVRMSIDISLVTVRGPTRMSDRHIVVVLCSTLYSHPLDAITTKAIRARKLSDAPLGVAFFVTSNRGDTAGVVPSTFQNLQTLDTNGTCLWTITEVSNDTTALIGLLCLLILYHLSVQEGST